MELLELVIRDRSGVVLKTQVRALSSFNSKGKFDILPMHSNYISIIERGVYYFDENNKSHEYRIEKALMKVASNKINVFLSI